MGGGIAQLASYGTADIYLTGNPQITYWKSVSRRHTNFAMESIQQSFQGPVDFGKKCTATISRTGDLATTMWLQVTLPDLTKYIPFVQEQVNSAHAVIKRGYFASATSMVVEAIAPTSTSTFIDTYTAMAYDSLNTSTSSSIPIIQHVALTSATNGFHDATITFNTVTATASYAVVCTYPGMSAPVTASSMTNIVTLTGLPANTTLQMYGVATLTNNALVTGQSVYTVPSTTFTFNFANLPQASYVCKVVGRKSNSNNYSDQSSLPQTIVNVKWCNSVGHALIQSVELELGGARIDRHISEWFDARSELTEKEEKRQGFNTMVGKYDSYDIWDWTKSSNAQKTFYIPLVFYCNRSPGMAIPLVSLQFHEVKLNFELRTFRELLRSHTSLIYPTDPSFVDCKLYVDYVFLDQQERIRYAQMPHEYLIEQVQYQGAETIIGSDSPTTNTLTRKVALNFNHPVKELVWIYSPKENYSADSVAGNRWFDYDIPGFETQEIFNSVRIQLNGADRFGERPGEYFRFVQPYQHHTRCPTKKVYVYSFALNPEDFQPSGTCNMSRIDTTTFYVTLNELIKTGRIHIWAVGYNVLRISNGLGGLAFVGS